VVPVNIDNVQTSTKDVVPYKLAVPCKINNQTLYFLDINHLGSYSIPNVTNAHIVLWVCWRYNIKTNAQNLFDTWNLYISTDTKKWTKLESFEIPDDGYTPVDGGINYDLNLESFKGKTVYLKYDGIVWGEFTVFRIIQFNR
jgi:hypothetical protein